jgi:hypothetical protein
VGHRALVYVEEYGRSSGMRAGDAIVAATATENGLTLVTGNARHFRPIKDLSCRICTIRLVRLCYERARWFRWFREPLILVMRLLARWHRIDPRDYAVRSRECHGCLRFLKEDLKEKSRLFARLNDLANPTFNRLRDSIVTQEEIEEARRFARNATEPQDDQDGPAVSRHSEREGTAHSEAVPARRDGADRPV